MPGLVAPLKKVAQTVTSHPLGFAMGALAVGVVAGLALPATRLEDERIGDLADRAKARLRESGQDLLAQGKEVAQEAASAAVASAFESPTTSA
jgi:hypothetical protein